MLVLTGSADYTLTAKDVGHRLIFKYTPVNSVGKCFSMSFCRFCCKHARGLFDRTILTQILFTLLLFYLQVRKGSRGRNGLKLSSQVLQPDAYYLLFRCYMLRFAESYIGHVAIVLYSFTGNDVLSEVGSSSPMPAVSSPLSTVISKHFRLRLTFLTYDLNSLMIE